MNTLLWLAVLLAAVLATAILTRRHGGHLIDTAIRAAAGLTTVGLAGIAAAISYEHLQTLAQEHGQTGWRANAFPLSVDGLELVSSLVLLADRRAEQRSGWLPWVALCAGAVASLFANIAVAEPDWIARTIAGWPALALIIAIKLLSGLLEHAATPQPSTIDAQPRPQPAEADTLVEGQQEIVEAARQRGRNSGDAARRLPSGEPALARWRQIWHATKHLDTATAELAAEHGVSLRTLQFIRAAGEQGHLDPTVRFAAAPGDPAAIAASRTRSNHHGAFTGS